MSDTDQAFVEMVDYAIDMLSAELPLIEMEYGWTASLQASILGKMKALRDAGAPRPGETLVSELDGAGVAEGSFREICAMIDAAN